MKHKKSGMFKSSMNAIFTVYKNSFFANKLLFFLNVLTSAMAGVSIIFEALFPEWFINLITGKEDLGKEELILNCFFLIAFLVVYGLLNGTVNLCTDVFRKYIRKYNRFLLCLKQREISVETYENSKFLDYIKKADDGTDAAGFIPIIVNGIIFFYAPALFGLLVYYAKLSPLLCLCVLLTAIPALFVERKKEKNSERYFEEIANDERAMDYLDECISSRGYFKENIHLAFFEKLFLKWNSRLVSYVQKKKEAQIKALVLDGLSKICVSMGSSMMIVIIVLLVISRQINIGEFTAVLASFSSFAFLADEMINKNLMLIAEHIGAIKNLTGYLSIKSEKGKQNLLPSSNDCEIALENVFFKYPNTDRNALSDVNISIKRGEYVAIVGENGSGKTTLSKILLGLYNPTSGTVKRKTDGSVSAVFQDFIKYRMTLKENICISNVFDREEKIRDLISKVKIEEKNENLFLGKEFGGEELSGGQWQRVAIARGCYARPDILVLDEPTAAIDPFQENELFDLFEKVSKSCTLVVVTHRLGCVKNAKKIIVLKNGKIVEQGNLKQLLSQKGEFYSMYEKQKVWYV
jgi:ATP-binding cassette subfamily B protein